MKRIGPGPGKYLLPPTLGCNNHDYTKFRLPCYSIGTRPKGILRSEGPGPGKFYVDNLTRFGKKSYQTHMGIRLRDIRMDKGPAPNKYLLPELTGKDRTKVYMSKSPEYLMGGRLEINTRDRIPGPNAYRLPSEIGQDSKNVYPNKAPSYTLRKRTHVINHFTGPGPAKYYPELKTCRLGTRIKSRHNELIKMHSPSPNRYNLQEYKPKIKSPAYSMGLRLNGVSMPCIIEGDN